jgi:predicted nuclease with RNAse H fold
LIGIDLAGSQARETGFCIIDSNLKCTLLTTLFKDEEILEYVDNCLKAAPSEHHRNNIHREVSIKRSGTTVIAVDAPLSLPRGRDCLKDDCACRFNSLRNGLSPHFRECDKQLLKMGIRFFPITLGPMRKLTERGMELKKKIIEKNPTKNVDVIEVFPGASQDILNIPRKEKAGRNIGGLMVGLEMLGIKNIKLNANDHELDAVTAAYTAKLYMQNTYIALGDESEGVIIIPIPTTKKF